MFTDVAHSCMLLRELSELRNRHALCDVELLSGGSVIYAHKVVLSAFSEYFCAMFTGKMVESALQVVGMLDVDEKALALIIDFAYTGCIPITVHNVRVLLSTANMLGIQQVVVACCDFLKKQLNASNCLELLDFADAHSLDMLMETCLQYAEDHFLDVVCKSEFLSASCESVFRFLSSDNLNVNVEEDVYKALEQWTMHDRAQRICLFYENIMCVRLTHLSQTYVSYLQSHILLKCLEAYKLQMLLQAQVLLRTNPFRLLDPLLVKQLPPRRGSNRILVFGGKDGLLQPLRSCEKYHTEQNWWQQCEPLPKPIFDSASTYCNGKVYLCGGVKCNDDAPTRLHSASVLCYDVAENRWESAPRMTCKRSSLAVVSLRGQVYAIGGYDGTGCLQSVERFDPASQEWKVLEDMHYSRSWFAAVTLDEYIYVLGGQGTAHLSTVERYDSKCSKWELMPAMGTKRINFGAAQVHGFIYVVGGHDGYNYLRTMERFDPICSEWVIVAPLPSPRTGLGVAVVKDLIYVIGGHDGTRYLNTVYKYDPLSDTWEARKDMANPRCYMSVCPVWGGRQSLSCNTDNG